MCFSFLFSFFREKQLKRNIIKIILLTDLSQKKFFGFPDDVLVDDGLCGDLQHVFFLIVGWEWVGHIKHESSIFQWKTASDPLTWLWSVSAAGNNGQTKLTHIYNLFNYLYRWLFSSKLLFLFTILGPVPHVLLSMHCSSTHSWSYSHKILPSSGTENLHRPQCEDTKKEMIKLEMNKLE